MSNTRVPAGARDSYPAPGLALTPGHVRNQAMTVVAIPFVLIVVLAVVLATADGDDEVPGTGGLYGSGALPGWGSGTDDGGTDDDSTDGTTEGATDGTTDDGTNPDGSGGLTGGGTWPYDGTTDGTATDDTDTGTGTGAEDAGTDAPYAAGDGPEATVSAYFEAINDRDFTTAWELGGKNLDPDYAHFVAGFETTDRDDVTVTGTAGDEVSVTVVAWDTDGTPTTYEGTYTVLDGVITAADMREGN
ncbi:hypothetical protein [Streptomyces sp. enrichment culture]|uniref:hypothetical protein n=1 Tax=Streptomyces sp. enrichment culture TaxID=1795815 RepID=UPI003F569818